MHGCPSRPKQAEAAVAKCGRALAVDSVHHDPILLQLHISPSVRQCDRSAPPLPPPPSRIPRASPLSRFTHGACRRRKGMGAGRDRPAAPVRSPSCADLRSPATSECVRASHPTLCRLGAAAREGKHLGTAVSRAAGCCLSAHSCAYLLREHMPQILSLSQLSRLCANRCSRPSREAPM